jgi:dienelactone hydrolase
VALLAFGVVATLAWRPVSLHLRAAELLSRFGEVDRGASPSTTEELLSVPRDGAAPLRARLYTPDGSSHGAVVLVPGVHRLGIDEPRLVRFARALTTAGITVLTPEIPELVAYRIEGASSEDIGDAARLLSERRGHPVGVMGMSFAGGLSLLAAADPRFAPSIAFVVSVGGHDDLGRVARFFATGDIPRPDGSTLHMAPHPYGPLVLVYDHVGDFFPPADVPEVEGALRLWLWEEKDAARARASSLPPASQAKLLPLFDGKLDAIDPELLAEVTTRAAAMSAASPHGHLAGLKAAVYLLHGAGDAVIPPSEAEWLAEDVPHGLVKDELVSPAIVHVEMEGKPSLREQWALVHFMADVLGAADGS